MLFTELGSAYLVCADGHPVIVDNFKNEAIYNYGKEHPVFERGFIRDFPWKERRVKVHISGEPIVELPEEQFKQMMRTFLASRFPQGIQIPAGRRIIDNEGYIIAVRESHGDFNEYHQVKLHGDFVKVHVTGEPYQIINRMTWIKLMQAHAGSDANNN